MADHSPPAAADPSNTANNAKQTELANLTAVASQKYALKLYPAAADLYSQAANLQSELRDEMDPRNADILYRYGRSLYHVGVAKSDVLGGKVAGTAESTAKSGGGQKRKREQGDAGEKEDVVVEKVVEKAVEGKEGMKDEGGVQHQVKEESKPFFQITGDDDEWEDEDSDAEDGAADGGTTGADGEGQEEGEEEEEEEDNDFATAYEVLDLSRLLFSQQIDQLTSSEPTGADFETQLRSLRANLADTHDLLAEISLEDERFADAVPDATASLDLKKQLHPQSSNLVAEAHFKLSLALEFASMPTAGEQAVELEKIKANGGEEGSSTGGAGEQNGEASSKADGKGDGDAAKEGPKIDWELRNQAVEHMQAAIESSKLRLQGEEAKLSSETDESAKEDLRATVQDIKEILQDMEQRIQDLHSPPPTTTTDPTAPAGPAGAPLDPNNPLTGILGSILGESPAEQRARIEEATRGARDLTGLVRSRGGGGGGEGKKGEKGEKRKGEEGGETGKGKRVKLDDGRDA
ncbi:MAG: hypothetical protein M1831_001199 [Alyxoria varia]|nr:MAG: hypothetical protein M1831_001199 [Alyxoria varia]